MSLSRMRAIERGSSTRAEPSTSRWSSARPAPPGNVSGNALSVFSAVTSVCHEPDHGEAGHEQHHEYYREQVEVAVNEPLDRRTEHPDEPGHQEESRAAAHERNQDELQQWNLERPAGYRKHLVRHRGESGSTERQHEVLPVETSHMFELVHHTVQFEFWTPNLLEQSKPYVIAENAANYRAEHRDLCKPKSALRPAERQCHEQHVGRDRKKG